jgi:threonyl-tRNA synthetase
VRILIGHAVKQLFPISQDAGLARSLMMGSYSTTSPSERPYLDGSNRAATQQLIEKDHDVIKSTPAAVIDAFTARGEDYKPRLVEGMPDEQAMGLYYHEEYVDYVPARTCRTRVFSKRQADRLPLAPTGAARC